MIVLVWCAAKQESPVFLIFVQYLYHVGELKGEKKNYPQIACRCALFNAHDG